jgi:hypothetical protein
MVDAMSRRIAVCIATRGNPETLVETLCSILPYCDLPATTVVLGLDEDDPALPDTRTVLNAIGDRRIVVSVAPREDSIGAVYNRCAAAVDADLFINGADDFKILTRGWDVLLAQAAEFFPDDIGMLGFGQMPWPSILPGVSATTRGLIEKMGYFVQPFTPYWWMDTWLYEIATMIGRSHYVPIDVEMLGPVRTRGLRDFTYWVSFVDDMRIHRRAIAKSILTSPEFMVSDERRQELLQNLDHVCAEFQSAHVLVRNPAHAAGVEAGGYDAPDDERYRRIKARSMKVMEEWRGAAVA